MRVVHVTPYFAPAFCYGGPPRSILGLCQGLRSAGIEVEVISTTANGLTDLDAGAKADRYDGVPVTYLRRAFPRPMFGVRGLQSALTAALTKCDLLHLHGLWTLPVWGAAWRARHNSFPYVISPRGMLDHGSLAHHRLRKRLAYHLIERRNLEGARLLHATSNAEASSLAKAGLTAPIVTLPNGVEFREPPPRGTFRRRLQVREESPLVVFLGRIHPIKRLDLLADAFAQARVRWPDARLVIAGPDDGGYRRRIAPIFARLGSAVYWTGPLHGEERAALLADADAMVICSDSESFGMSVVEGLAASVPVVVTRTCPWAEVEMAGCGFWVDQTAAAIAASLARLLSDRALARVMGARGPALVRERYSWESIGRRMAEHYAALLKDHRGER